MTEILFSYGTSLNNVDDNLSYDIGNIVYDRLKENDNFVFVSSPRNGNTFEFDPPPDLRSGVETLFFDSDYKVIDLYSTSIWDGIGRKHELWEGEGIPPEFLIESPQNIKGKSLIEKERRLDRGILTPYLRTVGEFSYKNFINKTPDENYYPVFISCNETGTDKKYSERKKLITDELRKLFSNL